MGPSGCLGSEGLMANFGCRIASVVKCGDRLHGSTFDIFVREAGIYREVSAAAIKRVVTRQVEDAMEQKGLTKAEMARRMHTSRAALDRLLDPENAAITLSTLQNAATVVGHEIRLELV